jgi:hypothetical protein
MKRIMVLSILVLFLMPLVVSVSAEPRESFAENPIPYWEDDSTNVNLTWDSTTQTVTYDLTPFIWEEDMSDVSDWGQSVGDGFDSDGDVMSIYVPNDYSYDSVETDDISIPDTEDLTFEYRMKANVSGSKIYVYAHSEDGCLGDMLYVFGEAHYTTTSWVTYSVVLPTATIESIRIRGRTNTKTEYMVDYIRVWKETGELDIAVPLEKDATQNIETMGNFSALNSTVRFQMYESGLWCDVNSTQVTFPDDTYAKFNDFARLNFSLNEEISIFTIYVSAQNMTLINHYSDYVGLANKDYLRMNDSVFEGSFQLWYLQGDVGYLEGSEDTTNIFYLLFLSTELWGYFGPVGLVIIGYILTKKERPLGIFFFIVDALVISHYLTLVEATPDYWWHTIILLLGIIICTIQMIDR